MHYSLEHVDSEYKDIQQRTTNNKDISPVKNTKRHDFTPAQQEYLKEACVLWGLYPKKDHFGRDLKELLAEHLGVPRPKVVVWFQNERQRVKKGITYAKKNKKATKDILPASDATIPYPSDDHPGIILDYTLPLDFTSSYIPAWLPPCQPDSHWQASPYQRLVHPNQAYLRQTYPHYDYTHHGYHLQHVDQGQLVDYPQIGSNQSYQQFGPTIASQSSPPCTISQDTQHPVGCSCDVCLPYLCSLNSYWTRGDVQAVEQLFLSV